MEFCFRGKLPQLSKTKKSLQIPAKFARNNPINFYFAFMQIRTTKI